MKSREKVLAMRQRLLSLKPEDESSAQQLQILAAISPLLVKAIPDDSTELDGYLRTIAWGAAQCRSDDAPKLALFELREGSDPEDDPSRWEPVDLEVEA